MPCTMRNLSPIGALLRLDEPISLTGSLSVLMNGTELRACNLVRLVGRDIGVSFRS